MHPNFDKRPQLSPGSAVHDTRDIHYITTSVFLTNDFTILRQPLCVSCENGQEGHILLRHAIVEYYTFPPPQLRHFLTL